MTKMERCREQQSASSATMLPLSILAHPPEPNLTSLASKNAEGMSKAYHSNIIVHVFNNGAAGRPPRKFVLTKRDLERWDATLEHIANALGVFYGDVKRYLLI